MDTRRSKAAFDRQINAIFWSITLMVSLCGAAAARSPVFDGARVMASTIPQRLVAQQQMTPADFVALAVRHGAKAVHARKIGFVAAVQATERRAVETRWNGKETANTAEVGDWVATNLDADQQPLRDAAGNLNVYVIAAARFPELYEAAGAASALGPVYRARAVVEVLRLPVGFDIVAPWGERQQGTSGYLIRNGDDVYGNAAETFEATYQILAD